MHARRYVLSMVMSSDSLVCRPCRQDVTRVVADPSHTPRWERGRTNSKSPCCVLNCTTLSFAHATISTGGLPPDIKFMTHPLPTPTPLCKHHYHAVYGVLQTWQRNCRTCGRRLQVGNDRPCPELEVHVVQAYLHQHTDFIGDIAKNDHVYFTCYESHLALRKQNNPTSKDDDLRPLVESVSDIGHMNSLIHTQIEPYIGRGDGVAGEPKLWNAIQTMTRSKSEVRGTSKLDDLTSQAHTELSLPQDYGPHRSLSLPQTAGRT